MFRIAAASLAAGLALAATGAGAQTALRDSVFADYQSYQAFVVDHVTRRDFVPFVQTLGGRDEYTPERLDAISADLRRAFPLDFTDEAVMKLVPLENGFFQEARAFWTGDQYGWYYALLHDTGEEIVVINFSLNTDVSVILDQF